MEHIQVVALVEIHQTERVYSEQQAVDEIVEELILQWY